MQIEQTARGFDYSDFTDKYGVKCSIQKSSAASEPCIWLGVKNAATNAKIMTDHSGRQPYNIPKEVLLHDRMYLNRKHVAELIPLLQKFVDTGELT